LRTGIRQPGAIGLCESAEYVAIPRHDDPALGPLSHCVEKAVGTVLVGSR
jgi:hypothetical protein